MQNTIDTQTKICACFNLSEAEYNLIMASSDQNLYPEHDNDDLYRLLLLNDMEEYQSFLLKYFSSFNENIDNQKKISSVNQMKYEQKIEHEIDLTTLLYFLLSPNNGCDHSISFHKLKGNETTNNKIIINSITESLIEQYKANDFHKINISYSEAIARLLLNSETASGVYPFPGETKDVVDQGFVQAFIDSNFKDMEINFTTISDKLIYLKEKYRKKSGAPTKDSTLSVICENLSYLTRVNRFLKHIEINDIDKMPITNNDCIFIRDIILHFKLESDFKCNSPASKIRTLIKQRKKHESEILFIDLLRYHKINEFKPPVFIFPIS